MVERELVDLARRGEAADDSYQLDLVVANVELLARDDDLKAAVGGLAEQSQLKLVVAVLSLVDRLVGKRSLVAEGELLPDGAQGRGLALALYRHNDLRARGVFWAGAPPAPRRRALKCAREETVAPTGPEPFYELAGRASSWIQYEAARSLNSHVGLMTDSPESFGRLATALSLHKAEEIKLAEEAYAEALAVDPENVAALVNLGLLQARYRGAYGDAIALLTKAQGVLEKRHGEMHEET